MSYHRIGKGGGKYWGKTGAGILFTDGKQILLLKRASGTDNSGKWGLPGGKAEQGETEIGTAIRETREETGLSRIPGNRIDTLKSKDGHHQFTVFIYRVDDPFKVRLSKEHTDWDWMDIGDLKSSNLHPKFRENMDRYTRSIRRKIRTFNEWLELKVSEV